MYKKIVLVDFSWVYNKYFFVAKQQEDESSLEIRLFTMLYQFLKRIADEYSRTKVMLVLDSALSETNNIKLNKDYKQNRNKEVKKEVYEFFKSIVIKLNDNLSKDYVFVRAKGYEADQVIASIACERHEMYPILIYSGDKDLLQLTSYSNVFSSDKFENGQFLVKTDTDIFNKFKNSKGEGFTRISNDKRDILKYRSLKGDPSDNLRPVFPRIKDKEISLIIREYWDGHEPLNESKIDAIIEELNKSDKKLANKLKESKSNWLTNYKIMDLQSVKGIKISSL